MKYKYEVVSKSGKVLAFGGISANDEWAAINSLASRYKYESVGDGWYKTVGGNAVEIQVKS